MELGAIVPLVHENVELFGTFWPPDPMLVQARPGICLIAMVRQAAGGGVLVGMQPLWSQQARFRSTLPRRTWSASILIWSPCYQKQKIKA